MPFIMILLQKTLYNKLVFEVNTIDSCKFVLKKQIQYNIDKLGLEKNLIPMDLLWKIGCNEGSWSKVKYIKLQKTNQRKFRMEKVIKKKKDKFSVKSFKNQSDLKKYKFQNFIWLFYQSIVFPLLRDVSRILNYYIIDFY